MRTDGYGQGHHNRDYNDNSNGSNWDRGSQQQYRNRDRNESAGQWRNGNERGGDGDFGERGDAGVRSYNPGGAGNRHTNYRHGGDGGDDRYQTRERDRRRDRDVDYR